MKVKYINIRLSPIRFLFSIMKWASCKERKCGQMQNAIKMMKKWPTYICRVQLSRLLRSQVPCDCCTSPVSKWPSSYPLSPRDESRI